MPLDAEQLLSSHLNKDAHQGGSLWTRARRMTGVFSEELGFNSLMSCSRDIYLIIFMRMIRLVAFHGVQLILIIYLKELEFDDRLVGLFMTITHLGDLITSFFLSVIADNVGRRAIFKFSSVVMGLTGVAFLLVKTHGLLIFISFIGIMTPGGDVGPFKSIESSSLASLVPYEKRSDIYAWYGFLAKCFASLGILSAGYLIYFAEQVYGLSVIDSYRTIFVSYVVIAVLMYISSVLLSPAVEWENETKKYKHVVVVTEDDEEEEITVERSRSEDVPQNEDTNSGEDEGEVEGQGQGQSQGEAECEDQDEDHEQTHLLSHRTSQYSLLSSHSRVSVHSRISHGSRIIVESVLDKIKTTNLFPKLSHKSYITVLKLSLLFGLDAFASSFIGGSWQIYYILHKFKVQPSEVGSMFFVTGLIAGFMSLLGSTLCKRIGPIATMVITHLPASLLIMVLPIPRNLSLTFGVLVLRSCVQSMDAAPKQVFLTAIVPPNERTSVIGWVHVVQTLCHTVGPSIAGFFLSWDKQWISFVIAGILKVTYDMGIMVTFMHMNRQHVYE
ncbi:uncharacterized membrane protein [[Candida] railenensis]|uniref:Uncharacterized membrane protein n=1 Tax=[Candida] railenensis TaxID=45579 RepID=A0A9P0QLS0_9ASCO|nr:uncharacterized membrane protein [[Candida] railenensis]